jgi:3D (Asp-Asp-Asp) domain-containing protein
MKVIDVVNLVLSGSLTLSAGNYISESSRLHDDRDVECGVQDYALSQTPLAVDNAGQIKLQAPCSETRLLGYYKLTAYCACKRCCGPKACGLTATGKKVRKGYVAVDPKVIPLHTRIVIEGLGTFQAEDTGSAIKGNRIDIYFESHEDALKFGVKQGVKVWKL